ncbi:19960_t:CDS:2, partial [Gigaspora rosea]
RAQKKRKSFHNLREKVIILNVAKAYRAELESLESKVFDDFSINLMRYSVETKGIIER